MSDTYTVWQLARLEQRIHAYASFLEACPWPDDEARRSYLNVVDLAQAELALGNVGEVQDCLWSLVEWAEPWRTRPGFPEVRSATQADRLARDLVKDHLRPQFPVWFRDRISSLKLSIDVTFNRLDSRSDLDRATRDELFYVYGRATMALDLGHIQAAEGELLRLKEVDEGDQIKG